MAQHGKADESAEAIETEKPEPIGVVKRELTRPDGSTVMVEVPVYAPFDLREGAASKPPGPRARKAPSLKRKRGGNSGEKSRS